MMHILSLHVTRPRLPPASMATPSGQAWKGLPSPPLSPEDEVKSELPTLAAVVDPVKPAGLLGLRLGLGAWDLPGAGSLWAKPGGSAQRRL